jgi:hypothetical protein
MRVLGKRQEPGVLMYRSPSTDPPDDLRKKSLSIALEEGLGAVAERCAPDCALPADAFNGPLTPEPSAPAPSSYAGPGGSSAGSFQGSPARSGSAGSSSAGGSSSSSPAGSGDFGPASRKRFGNGLGKKIRTALADFLNNR